MSYLDKIPPYRRRDKRDISLSRISTETINLATYKGYDTFFAINHLHSLKKKNDSIYARKLLNEILPDMKPERKIKRDKKGYRVSSAGTKTGKIFEFESLDRIIECSEKDNKVNYYNKRCNVKKHLKNDKFISNFLTPINNFISIDSNLYNEDYEEIKKKIEGKKKKKICLPKIPIDLYKESRLHVKQCKYKI